MTRALHRFRPTSGNGWTGFAASLAAHAAALGVLAWTGLGLYADTPAPEVPLALSASPQAARLVLDPRPLVDTRVESTPVPRRPDHELRAIERPTVEEPRPAFAPDDGIDLPDLVVSWAPAEGGAVERAPGARRRAAPSSRHSASGAATQTDPGADDAATPEGPSGPTTGPRLPATLEQPQYPSRARRRGWEGRVVLELDVDARGAVTGVRVLTSSGYGVLDSAATARARRWTLEPALENGVPVTGTLRVPIRFQLR